MNEENFENKDFPSVEKPVVSYNPPAPQNGHGFLKAVAMILAVALISVGSIVIYRWMPIPAVEPGQNKNPSEPGTLPIEYVSLIEPEQPKTDALTTVQIAKKVRPSVVTVITDIASGSGVIATEDGYVVTNNHVIKGARSIEIYLNDNVTHYPATLVAGDALSDIALLKVEATGLSAAEFGNSDSLQVGETAIAIGNPLGIQFAGTVTQGIISALDRQVDIEGVTMTLIQTDATINNGNSGGALVNEYGQVIGITSSKINTTYAEGLAFAIPSNDVARVAYDLLNLGYVSGRPYIGISGASVTYYMQLFYGIPNGVYVDAVEPESPAALAGIQRGDIIVAIDGIAITTFNELNNLKTSKNIGDSVTLTVYSMNQRKDIQLTLSEYKGQ